MMYVRTYVISWLAIELVTYLFVPCSHFAAFIFSAAFLYPTQLLSLSTVQSLKPERFYPSPVFNVALK